MNIFKKITNWYLGNNDREIEVPREGLSRIVYLLINYTGRLIAVNIVFIVSCIPIITIPAAITALNRYLTKMFIDGIAFDFSDYIKEFRSNFVRKTLLGAFAGVVMFYGYYLMSLAGNFEGQISGIFFGVGTAVLIGGLIFGELSLLIESTFTLDISYLIKDTFFLIFIMWRESLAAVIAAAAMFFLILTFMPYSLLIVIFMLFSLFHTTLIGIYIPKLVKKDI